MRRRWSRLSRRWPIRSRFDGRLIAFVLFHWMPKARGSSRMSWQVHDSRIRALCNPRRTERRIEWAIWPTTTLAP